MIKNLKNLLTGVALLALTAIPVALSLQVADYRSESIHMQQAQSMADEVMRRTDETVLQIQAATRALKPFATNAPCSKEEIALMRRLQISGSYLQGVGRVVDNRLLCSSHGAHGAGYSLGSADFIGEDGASVRLVNILDMAPDTAFIVVEKDGYAAIVHPELLFDVTGFGSDLSLAIVGAAPRRGPIAARGSAGMAGLKMPALQRGERHTIHNSAGIVALRHSDGFKVTAVAIVAQRAIDATAGQLRTWMVPVGLACGMLLAWGLLFLLRVQVSIPAMLRAALRRHEFFVVYQPIIRLDNRRCIGAEALLRWRRRDGTMVGPDLFIPIAEATGLIGSITSRMLDLVARDLPALVDMAPDLRVSVNLAPQDLGSTDIVGKLRNALRGVGVSPRNLVVEATERGLIDVTMATAVIRDIQNIGVRVAIDDFGTGYSCLSYLDNLNVDCLKIDKSFIDSVGTAAPTNSVVGHIIEMAKSLDLLMVAEGVESEAQAEFLRQRGVQYAQGWLFAKPMPAAEFLRFLAAQGDGIAGTCTPQAAVAKVLRAEHANATAA